MKKSIGYTVSLNIVIVFIVIIFVFICGAISYYKAYKVNSLIENSIEKYEGFNELSKREIDRSLSSLGYDMGNVRCNAEVVKVLPDENMGIPRLSGSGKGYCVYYNIVNCASTGETDKEKIKVGGETLNSGDDIEYCKAESYNYIIKTYLRFNIPIINKILKIPIHTKTNPINACYGSNC